MVQIPSLILMNFYCSFTKWNMDTYVNLSWFADLKVVIRKHNSRVVSMNDGYVKVVENECKVKDIAKITQPCSSFFFAVARIKRIIHWLQYVWLNCYSKSYGLETPVKFLMFFWNCLGVESDLFNSVSTVIFRPASRC